MADTNLLINGAIIGVGIAAPVGPIGLLCIQRTLSEGRIVGLASGMGAATADALYGVVAAFGLTVISAFLVDQRTALALVGGAMLLYFGVRTFLSKPAQEAARPEGYEGGSIASAWASTLFLTLTNPMTILMFLAIFAGAGVAQAENDWTGALLMVIGVFLGSAAWWITLTLLVSLLRKRITPAILLWINRVAGIVIFVFGIVALYVAISS
jgi:threonine/homoserine/homoserine lactone efflux protein